MNSLILQHLKGQTDVYCYLVKRGKLVAEVPVQNRYVDELRGYIQKKYGLCVYADPYYPGWTDLCIYKKKYVLKIMKAISKVQNAVFRDWAWGKLFGYSDEAIEEYLKAQTSSNSVPSHLGQGGKVSVSSSKVTSVPQLRHRYVPAPGFSPVVGILKLLSPKIFHFIIQSFSKLPRGNR